jgi:hypothetical protein
MLSSQTNNVKIQNTYTISDALSTLKAGLLILALAEYYDIKPSNVVGIVGEVIPRVYFDREGFLKVLAKENDILGEIKNTTNRAVTVIRLDHDLQLLSSLKIFKKFPLLQKVLDENQYININEAIGDDKLISRCKGMQARWKTWGDAGLVHLISSHQALQRLIASKMSKPLSIDMGNKVDNGLSIEYQCEIYADHLYGAKLLEIWHHYLLNSESDEKDPKHFLTWLKSLPIEKLNEFGIASLDEISKVVYMTQHQERAPWQLQLEPGNIVSGSSVPPPKHSKEEMEIIYALGKSQSHVPYFFGGVKQRGTINHSSFFGGGKVNGAGRMLLKSEPDSPTTLRWVIHDIDNNSGHIKPDDQMSLETIERLQELGLDLKAILWTSKWGTVGVRNETADIALKRLKNDLECTAVNYAKPHIESTFLKKMNHYAEKGTLGAVHDLLVIKGHKVRHGESLAVSFLIMKALENHLSIYEDSVTAHPEIAQSLSNQALKFLRNIGKKSPEFERDLENLIKRYELEFTVFQRETIRP